MAWQSCNSLEFQIACGQSQKSSASQGMAWQSSKSLEFQMPCGQSFTTTLSLRLGHASANLIPDRESFEKINPAADVPLLASAARHWQYVASHIPGFTPQMLSVADLLYATDHSLASHLNSISKNLGLQKFKHVSDAMDQVSSRFISVAEREALELTLDQSFGDIAGDSAPQCREQWSNCVDWMDTRASVAPFPVLGSSASMQAAASQQRSASAGICSCARGCNGHDEAVGRIAKH